MCWCSTNSTLDPRGIVCRETGRRVLMSHSASAAHFNAAGEAFAVSSWGTSGPYRPSASRLVAWPMSRSDATYLRPSCATGTVCTRRRAFSAMSSAARGCKGSTPACGGSWGKADPGKGFPGERRGRRTAWQALSLTESLRPAEWARAIKAVPAAAATLLGRPRSLSVEVQTFSSVILTSRSWLRASEQVLRVELYE